MPPRNEPLTTDRLRHYVAQGMTPRAIADRAGVHRCTVYAAMKAAGIATKKKAAMVAGCLVVAAMVGCGQGEPQQAPPGTEHGIIGMQKFGLGAAIYTIAHRGHLYTAFYCHGISIVHSPECDCHKKEKQP